MGLPLQDRLTAADAAKDGPKGGVVVHTVGTSRLANQAPIL
jgi:hypothetical protein